MHVCGLLSPFVDILIYFLPLQVRAMEGRWTNTSFVALETRLLYDLVSLIKKKQPYDR
jgi:hypothetical protein